MELIFSAALCSVLVSILLKVCKTKGFDALQMIAWNYAIASILCFFWFKPDLAHISIEKTPWWLIATLGVVLPTIFLLLTKSLETAGIIKTEMAQRLSVVLSLSAAYFLFHEQFSQLKIIGIALGIVAVLMIIFPKSGSGSGSSSQSAKAMLYLLCVWAGYALVDILLKYTTSLGLQFAVSLNLMFIFAFVLTIGYLSVTKTKWNTANILAGFSLGVLNFANIALYVKAHMLLKDSPAIVFAGMNILVVLFGVVAGLMIFKEKLNMATAFGLTLGIAGVICLAKAI
ncbi:DMT family transporter [Acinetobacter shaoyimingii]|uniref:DMT family transporter n=1 Tax=Acinetobacter shaoyimingii TaxID=2715164 RepID=A0A6G8RUX7_9GAMM|nr:DMT family transporter [Acinetobacter shaoyimingii]QIO05724.1 DMT family transporter [Acinetobacter shaoyimingii]